MPVNEASLITVCGSWVVLVVGIVVVVAGIVVVVVDLTLDVDSHAIRHFS
jgi:hypothetical protein